METKCEGLHLKTRDGLDAVVTKERARNQFCCENKCQIGCCIIFTKEEWLALDRTKKTATVSDPIESRMEVRGDPLPVNSAVAKAWSVILGIKVEDYQVPLMMLALKQCREIVGKHDDDNWVDGGKQGYQEILKRVIRSELTLAEPEGDAK